MSVKILLIGARICKNLGGPSLLITTKKVLDHTFKNAEYVFISPTDEDISLSEQYGIKIIKDVSPKKLLLAAILKRFAKISCRSIETHKVLKAFLEADIVIDIWGIEFTDFIGGKSFRSRALTGHFLTSKLLGKPVIKYTADLGPFELKWNKFFSKFYLQKTVSFILSRSASTKERVEKLGVKTPIKVFPDTAFLLESQTSRFSEELKKESRPIVGFSVSYMSSNQSQNPEKYRKIMADLADDIIEKINAKIVFIPNEISDNQLYDDGYISKLIIDKMVRKDDAVIAPAKECTAPQLKGIIGVCNVIIAARYHTIVAALSQSIPVLAIGWHAKYHAILTITGQEHFLCSVKSLGQNILKEKFDKLWNSREQIHQEIEKILPEIKQNILRGGEEILNLLKEKI